MLIIFDFTITLSVLLGFKKIWLVNHSKTTIFKCIQISNKVGKLVMHIHTYIYIIVYIYIYMIYGISFIPISAGLILQFAWWNLPSRRSKFRPSQPSRPLVHGTRPGKHTKSCWTWPSRNSWFTKCYKMVDLSLAM